MLGKIKPDLQQNLFKNGLTDLINLGYPLIKLANEIAWDKKARCKIKANLNKSS
jgi:hypothetical protein